jgi:hypothetical protein
LKPLLRNYVAALDAQTVPARVYKRKSGLLRLKDNMSLERGIDAADPDGVLAGRDTTLDALGLLLNELTVKHTALPGTVTSVAYFSTKVKNTGR